MSANRNEGELGTQTAAVPVAAAAPTAALTPPPAPVTIRHGDIRINSAAGIYLAKEHGSFAEQGLNVELETFASSTEQIPPWPAANSRSE